MRYWYILLVKIILCQAKHLEPFYLEKNAFKKVELSKTTHGCATRCSCVAGYMGERCQLSDLEWWDLQQSEEEKRRNVVIAACMVVFVSLLSIVACFTYCYGWGGPFETLRVVSGWATKCGCRSSGVTAQPESSSQHLIQKVGKERTSVTWSWREGRSLDKTLLPVCQVGISPPSYQGVNGMWTRYPSVCW